MATTIASANSEIYSLGVDKGKLQSARDNLELLETELINKVQTPLNDGGLIIDGEMPFQFYIDSIEEDISKCIANIDTEMSAISTKIKGLYNEIDELEKSDKETGEKSKDTMGSGGKSW